MSATPSRFSKACCDAFQFLVECHGFTEPECETIGRETYVRFHRGEQSVSIAHESGAAPVVELFFPAVETGEPPIPWAAKNGVPRARRIPRLRVKEPFDDQDPDSVRRHLQASARALAQSERDWLDT